MPLSDIVQIAITSDSVKVLQAGFGVPLILSATAAWAERTRTYTDLAGIAADGFATTSPEYKMATALFSQNPRPEKVVIGRLGNKPTQRFSISVKTVEHLKTYQIKVGANTASYTADAATTNDEIVAGLMAAVNALAGDTTTATTDAAGGAGTHKLVLTANAAGNFDAVEIVDPNYLEIVQNHVDPGVAADLTAIALENSTWYTVLCPFNSMAMVQAIAGWVEANKKTFIYQTQDTATISTALAGTDDVAEALQAAAYARSMGIYSARTDDFADAGWAGNCLPRDPGSETWKFKTLAGVTARPLTATHIANATAKNLNIYETIAGVNQTREGVVAAGEYFDVVRFRDWLEARMQERIFATLAKNAKIPFTDAGVALIEADVRAQLKDGIVVGGIAADPVPVVTVPKVKDVAPADKAARLLRNVKFQATLAGAVHKLVISGNVAV